MFATSLIGTIVGLYIGGAPLQTCMLRGFLVGGTLGMAMWWIALSSGLPGAQIKFHHIFYENNVTPDEVARFEAQDQIETLAHNMAATPGYGFAIRDPRGIM